MLIKTVDLFTFRITSVMTSDQLFIAEPEFLHNQQVIEIDDTVDSGENIFIGSFIESLIYKLYV
jgi:hypothetical protein